MCILLDLPPFYLINLGDFRSRFMESVIILHHSCLMLLAGGLALR